MSTGTGNIGIKLLNVIKQGQFLEARVQSTQVLNSKDQQLLQKVNPSLSQQLSSQATQNRTATSQSGLAEHSVIYLSLIHI